MGKYTIELLKKIIPLFHSKGFKSVNMDDIASYLHISKKTLYKYFDNKKDVVKQSVLLFIVEEKEFTNQLLGRVADPIEQLLHVSQYIQKVFLEMNPETIFELQKYYPESWELIDDYMSNNISKLIKENINLGKKLGLYRDNFDTDLIARLYIAHCDAANHDFDLMKKLNRIDVIKQSFEYHLRGIATEKGLKKLDSFDQYTDL